MSMPSAKYNQLREKLLVAMFTGVPLKRAARISGLDEIEACRMLEGLGPDSNRRWDLDFYNNCIRHLPPKYMTFVLARLHRRDTGITDPRLEKLIICFMLGGTLNQASYYASCSLSTARRLLTRHQWNEPDPHAGIGRMVMGLALLSPKYREFFMIRVFGQSIKGKTFLL